MFICALIESDSTVVQHWISQDRYRSSVGSSHPAQNLSPEIQPPADHATEKSTQYLRILPQVQMNLDPVDQTKFTILRLQDSTFRDHGFRKDYAEKAVNVKSNFKDGEFTGEDVKHKINELLNEYKIWTDQQYLSYVQKCNLFVKVFEGTANRFYMLIVKPQMYLESGIAMMEREYYSETKRIQAQAEHESLTLSPFISSWGRGTHRDD